MYSRTSFQFLIQSLSRRKGNEINFEWATRAPTQTGIHCRLNNGSVGRHRLSKTWNWTKEMHIIDHIRSIENNSSMKHKWMDLRLLCGQWIYSPTTIQLQTKRYCPHWSMRYTVTYQFSSPLRYFILFFFFHFSHSKKCSNTNGIILLKPVVFYKFNFHSNVNMFMRNVHFIYCLKMGP